VVVDIETSLRAARTGAGRNPPPQPDQLP